MARGKLYDLKDWIYYYLNLSSQKIPLLGESSEDFYIRRFYGTSADCFARPICTAASNHFKIVLRKKILVEKIFRLCYILRGLRKQAEKSEDLRKHGHSILKAPPNATES